MIDMLKHYTLEQLQETDIDLLLPLYFWYCKEKEKVSGNNPLTGDENIVYRGGKPYKVKKADEIGNVF
ncbi:hypothetical protein CAFE_23450 [Caprobacter fermentans]|uniref:Uncharacterized protein n=1 Tax=Caproicibacter fermentans TaxID=2576756 RepID=A0A6N8I274_9FIRM|nr:hypothetical protein [Caproicibacter fermentans]MVB11623.1 hypothetical protein [Caproicibacter fermentans]